MMPIRWGALKNPILSLRGIPLKDQCLLWDEEEGVFWLFCSAVAAKSQDLHLWTPAARYRMGSSPDIIRTADGSYFAVSHYRPAAQNWLWRWFFRAVRMRDLRIQTFGRTLGRYSLQYHEYAAPRHIWFFFVPVRKIDGALARDEEGYFWLIYKGWQWTYICRSRRPGKLAAGWERPRRVHLEGGWAENYQLIKIDGHWHLIATAKTPGAPRHTYTRGLEPYIWIQKDWTHWHCRRRLEVPVEQWNRVMTHNTAHLLDFRAIDGYFYLTFSGANDSKSFRGRGHGKIGIARSKDLVRWEVP